MDTSAEYVFWLKLIYLSDTNELEVANTERVNLQRPHSTQRKQMVLVILVCIGVLIITAIAICLCYVVQKHRTARKTMKVKTVAPIDIHIIQPDTLSLGSDIGDQIDDDSGIKYYLHEGYPFLQSDQLEPKFKDKSSNELDLSEVLHHNSDQSENKKLLAQTSVENRRLSTQHSEDSNYGTGTDNSGASNLIGYKAIGNGESPETMNIGVSQNRDSMDLMNEISACLQLEHSGLRGKKMTLNDFDFSGTLSNLNSGSSFDHHLMEKGEKEKTLSSSESYSTDYTDQPLGSCCYVVVDKIERENNNDDKGDDYLQVHHTEVKKAIDLDKICNIPLNYTNVPAELMMSRDENSGMVELTSAGETIDLDDISSPSNNDIISLEACLNV